jgi:hypothetical protein
MCKKAINCAEHGTCIYIYVHTAVQNSLWLASPHHCMALKHPWMPILFLFSFLGAKMNQLQHAVSSMP